MNRRLPLVLGVLAALLLGASPASADDPTPGSVTYEDIDDGCTATGATGDLEHGAAVGLASIALAMALRSRRGSGFRLQRAACFGQ
jgi:hypothetical protein